MVRWGHRGAFYSVSVTLHGVESGRSLAKRGRLWLLIGSGGGIAFSAGAAGGAGATLEFAGGEQGDGQSLPADTREEGLVLRGEALVLEGLER